MSKANTAAAAPCSSPKEMLDATEVTGGLFSCAGTSGRRSNLPDNSVAPPLPCGSSLGKSGLLPLRLGIRTKLKNES